MRDEDVGAATEFSDLQFDGEEAMEEGLTGGSLECPSPQQGICTPCSHDGRIRYTFLFILVIVGVPRSESEKKSKKKHKRKHHRRGYRHYTVVCTVHVYIIKCVPYKQHLHVAPFVLCIIPPQLWKEQMWLWLLIVHTQEKMQSHLR